MINIIFILLVLLIIFQFSHTVNLMNIKYSMYPQQLLSIEYGDYYFDDIVSDINNIPYYSVSPQRINSTAVSLIFTKKEQNNSIQSYYLSYASSLSFYFSLTGVNFSVSSHDSSAWNYFFVGSSNISAIINHSFPLNISLSFSPSLSLLLSNTTFNTTRKMLSYTSPSFVSSGVLEAFISHHAHQSSLIFHGFLQNNSSTFFMSSFTEGIFRINYNSSNNQNSINLITNYTLPSNITSTVIVNSSLPLVTYMPIKVFIVSPFFSVSARAQLDPV